MQIDINTLREQFKNNPTKLEILNYMYVILEKNNFPDRIEIALSCHYSSNLKKQTSLLLGYQVEGKKIKDTFWVKKIFQL